MNQNHAFLVIDIGSNSIVWTLTHAQTGETINEGCGRYEAKLKLGLNENGELTEPYRFIMIETVNKAIEMARVAAQSHGLALIVHCFATQFLRQAQNKNDVRQQFERTLNVPLRILSSDEETLFELNGVKRSPLIQKFLPQSFMHIDLGGGSTEISIVDQQLKSVFTQSVRLGKLDYWTRYTHHDTALFEPCNVIIAKALTQYTPNFILVGGGSMTSYARYVLGCAHEPYNAERLESRQIHAQAIVPQDDEKAIIGQQFVLLLTSLAHLPIFVTTLGVRDGYIRSLLSEQ